MRGGCQDLCMELRQVGSVCGKIWVGVGAGGQYGGVERTSFERNPPSSVIFQFSQQKVYKKMNLSLALNHQKKDDSGRESPPLGLGSKKFSPAF